MKGKRKGGRIFAVLLAMALCFGLLTVPAWAAEDGYQYEKLEYYSKITADYTGDSCCYTDEWFLGNSAKKNDSLALLSAQLSCTAVNGPQSTDFLKALGFEDAALYRYDSTDPSDCGYTLGTKKLPGGRTVVAVVFDGMLYGDKGWQQNVTVNPGGEVTQDQGSYAAAAQAFLEDFDKLSLPGNSILWVTGISRAGAVANLACAYLIDRGTDLVIHCYTFESPATTDNKDAGAKKYTCIHNYLSSDDPVPMLPIWGMTRYGEEVVYDKGDLQAVTAELMEALGRQNADAQEYAKQYDAEPFGNNVRAFLEEKLLAKLAVEIPARADYSRLRTDRLPDGTEINYSYQNGLQALCHMIFGSGGPDAVKGALADNLDTLLSNITYASLIDAYVADRDPSDGAELLVRGAQHRWDAAGILYEAAVKDHPEVTQADLYALAGMLGPLLTETGTLDDEGWTLPSWDAYVEENWQYYDLDEMAKIVGGINTLVFSHHPDVVIARLKMLAPGPEMKNVALEIQKPKAGDAGKKAAGEAVAAADALGNDWLGAEAEWLTEDDPLQDGKVYYLRITLDAIGHSVPESFSFTLNGQKPESLDVSWDNGSAKIAGVWSYTLGEADPVTVFFDVGGHGETPEAVRVNKGAMLRYALADLPEQGIVKDESGIWRFDGWKSGSGENWDALTANDDLTLCAAWTRMIDTIELNCDLPVVGDTVTDGHLDIRAPEDAPYTVEAGSLTDEHYESVERITKAEPLHTLIWIHPEEGAEFLTKKDENGEEQFDGVFTLNGEPIEEVAVEYEYDSDGEMISCFLSGTFYFTPADQGGMETLPFVDVPDSAYYADAVKWAWKNGITAGTDKTHFSPDGTATRGQMVTFLWRAAGCPDPETEESPFSDVAESDYFCRAVLWAVEKGITNGTENGRFTPGAPVTRSHAAAFLYRYEQSEGGGFPEGEDHQLDFSDAGDVPEYAYEAFCYLTEEGVIRGSKGKLMPMDPCLRGQIVMMLCRFFEQ